jgi:hypothetical protein
MAGRKIWTVLLALWFLIWGFLQVTNITIQFAGVILGFLALLVALFIFIDR